MTSDMALLTFVRCYVLLAYEERRLEEKETKMYLESLNRLGEVIEPASSRRYRMARIEVLNEMAPSRGDVRRMVGEQARSVTFHLMKMWLYQDQDTQDILIPDWADQISERISSVPRDKSGKVIGPDVIRDALWDAVRGKLRVRLVRARDDVTGVTGVTKVDLREYPVDDFSKLLYDFFDRYSKVLYERSTSGKVMDADAIEKLARESGILRGEEPGK